MQSRTPSRCRTLRLHRQPLHKPRSAENHTGGTTPQREQAGVVNRHVRFSLRVSPGAPMSNSINLKLPSRENRLSLSASAFGSSGQLSAFRLASEPDPSSCASSLSTQGIRGRMGACTRIIRLGRQNAPVHKKRKPVNKMAHNHTHPDECRRFIQPELGEHQQEIADQDTASAVQQ